MDDRTGSTLDAALASNPGPAARAALEYTRVMKQILDQAKTPGFTNDDWAPLSALVDVEKFERVGSFMEMIRWPAYLDLLTMWATQSEWFPCVRRVTEQNGVAFLELAELAIYDGREERINSVSVYEFGADGRLAHLDIYIQSKPGLAEEQHKETWDFAKN